MNRRAVAIGGGRRLTLDDVVLVARHGASVVLTAEAEEAILRGQASLDALARSGRTIYGFTTGVGPLDTRPLTPEDNRAFQRNLLLSHAAGVGTPMSTERVRAMLLTRVNVLAKGKSGARLSTVRALSEIITRGVVPIVPEIGSVGASDLSALSHACLLLTGDGWAMLDGTRVPGRTAMNAAGIPLPELSGRDGLALINGPSQTLGTGALAAHDALRLVRSAELAVAMTLAGAAGRTDFLDARLLEGERDPDVASAARLRELLALDERGRGGDKPATLREPLSTRCAPEMLGAARTAAARACAAIENELGRAIDNPTILGDGDLSNNAGTMHVQQVAEALDALSTSMTALASMSERRTARLVNPELNGGLPAFLVHPAATPGLHSGLMIPQYTAAALVAELRASGSPASTQSIPVANGTEDHGSMSALAARRAAWTVSLAETVIAIELLTAAQAIDLRALAAGTPVMLGRELEHAHRELRARSKVLECDRLLADEIDAVLAFVRASDQPG